jgi:hypothetical protein
MSSFVKAVIVVVVSVVLLVSLVIGIGYFWWSRHGEEYVEEGKQVFAEGRKFGVNTDKSGCVSESLSRLKQDEGITGSLKSGLFLRGCLDSSRETPGFCDGVPQESGIMKSAEWRTEQCTKAGLNGSYCPQLFGQVQKYCDERRKR